MWRRLVPSAIGCLVLGALATVLAAWACAAWSPHHWDRPRGASIDVDGRRVEFMYRRGFGVSAGYIRGGYRASDPAPGRLARFNDSMPVAAAPAWAVGPASVARWPASPDGRAVEIGAGFPFTAVRCLARDDGRTPGASRLKFSDGFSLPARAVRTESMTVFEERALPYSPVWRGLALDSIVFALLIAATACALRFLQRRHRRRRGRCPRCGYLLRGLPADRPCPECGSAPGVRPGTAEPVA